MEPTSGIGLGRPVERMLQGTDPVLDDRQVDLAMIRHSPSSSPTHARERSSGPSLTGGYVVRRLDRYYGRLRRPPGQLPTSRLLTGYRHPRSDGVTTAAAGRGGPPQFPPPPSERSAPSTPGSSSRLHIQDLHRFHGLRPERPGSALPSPPRGGHINDAAGFASCCGPLSRSPSQGFRRCASTPGVSPDAGSLLPGSLTTTRTGLTPAGDDELQHKSGHVTIGVTPLCALGALHSAV